MVKLHAVVVVMVLLSATVPARGQDVRTASAVEDVRSLYKALVDHGVGPALIYEGEAFVDIAGGARRGAGYLDNLHLQLTLDLQRLVGWAGATVFLYGRGIHGGQPSEFAGDAQGVSSIAAPRAWTLYEAWFEQNLFGDRFSVLAGRYDLNSEFYRAHAADLFLNSSFGIGPEFSASGKGGPSVFPNTAVGGRLELKPMQGVVIRGAILDGVPVERDSGSDVFAKGDGLLFVGEAAFIYRPSRAGDVRGHRFRLGREAQLPPYDAKLAVGVWHYTATFPDLSTMRADGTPVTHNGSTGGYLVGDATVYKDEAGRQLRLFAQVGFGDPRVNRFGLYTGGGVTLAGVIPGRANDEIGFGVAAAHNGGHFIDQQRKAGLRVDRVETTLELTYLAPLTSWLSIQPDLQYVVNPNTDPRVPNAFVGLIRIELAF